MNAYEQLSLIRDQLELNGAHEDTISLVEKFVVRAEQFEHGRAAEDQIGLVRRGRRRGRPQQPCKQQQRKAAQKGDSCTNGFHGYLRGAGCRPFRRTETIPKGRRIQLSDRRLT